MGFVDSLGVLILVAGVVLLIGYGLRHRGAVSKWLENTGHKDNEEEKNDEILRLRRKREDIDHALERLEKED